MTAEILHSGTKRGEVESQRINKPQIQIKKSTKYNCQTHVHIRTIVSDNIFAN